jgi:hypothetical protein
MGKLVEHALLSHMCRVIREAGGSVVTIRFKKTARNREMRKILQDFGFSATQETDEQVVLWLHLDRETYVYPEWLAVQTDACDHFS